MKSFSLTDLPEATRLARKGLFTPCKSKEELGQWLRVYMKVRWPGKVVSPESNSSPLDIVWEIYDKCMRNDLEGFEQVMLYASRFSGKTASAAMLEVLVVLHMQRNVAHMAAIENQAKKAQEYVKGHFSRPILRDFVSGDNAREVKIVAWIHEPTGVPISTKEYDRLPASETPFYRKHEQYIKIVICTMAGANGDHVEFMVLDELDVIPKGNIKAYDQAKLGIPVGRDGCTAFTLMTSTRKSRLGLVQQEIDKAERTGLVLRHWNAIDVTAPCPPGRYRDDLPKQTYYVKDEDVKHLNESDFTSLNAKEREKYYPVEGYAGCAKCHLFPACKGALATQQQGHTGAFKDGGTALLVAVPEIASKFRAASPEFVTTEYLCRKPDASGMVFPRLNEEIHFKNPQQIARMVAGEDAPEGLIRGITDKTSLIKYLQQVGARFVSGMDFGFSHLFAVVTIAIWGQNAFVIDAIGQSHLELEDKLVVSEHLREWGSSIYGDPESPSDVTTFKRKGFRMVEWEKGKGSVNAGIEIVRSKIWRTGTGPSLFFLSDDPSIYSAFRQLSMYQFSIDSQGNWTNVPEKEDDDFADALRYAIMNAFGSKGSLKADRTVIDNKVVLPTDQQLLQRQQQNWMANHIRALTGEPVAGTSSDGGGTVIKRGGFVWDG